MSTKQAIKTNKLLEELRDIISSATFSDVYQKWQRDLNVLDLVNKGLRVIKFDDLPEEIDERTLMLNLFTRGKLVAFTHKTLGNFILPMTRFGGVNAYGKMTHIHPVAVGNQANDLNNLNLEDGVDCAVLRMNDLEVPPLLYAVYYGKKITETLGTIDNNNTWLKFPIVLKSSGDIDKDKKNSLVLKEIFDQQGIKMPVITNCFDNIELMNLKPQYFGLELFEQLKQWKNLYYEYLGVNHHEEKKERLTDDEVTNNQEESSLNADKIIEPLKESVDNINKILGWNIKVRLNIKNTGLYNTETKTEINSKGVR